MFKFKNVFLLAFVILLCSLAIQPSNFIFETIKVGELSEKDIFAPKSITYVDEKATEQLQQEALLQVQDVYDHDKNVYTQIEEDMNTFLTSLSSKKDTINKTLSAEKEKETKEQIDLDSFVSKELATVDNPFNFSEKELEAFLSVDFNSLKKYTDRLLLELKVTLYDKGVNEEQLESERANFKATANELLFYTTGSVDKVASSISEKLSNRMTANFLLNIEETKAREQEAIDSIEPIYKQVTKGELIIAQGVKVSDDTYEKLKQLGLIETQFEYKEFLFQIPYVSLLLILFHLYCFKFFAPVFNRFRNYIFLLVGIFLLMLSSNFIDDLRLFLVPLVVFLLTSTIIWGRTFVVSLSVILGFLLYSGEFVYATSTIIIGFIIALHYKPNGDRMHLIRTGVLVGLVFVLSQFIFKFTIDQGLTVLSLQFENNLWFLISTFSASILTIGIIPIIERSLNIVTNFRLYEYNNQAHPLLKRLVMEAPGTYDHSIKVGNLAEIAADNIGANGLLVRVAAYYHDVGKIHHPEYFIENTTPGTNPHAKLSPQESANVILAHPIDSVRLCKEYRLPQSVIDLVASHHSDSLLSHFYAIEKEANAEADESLFRYKCPTPKSKEEGILMLADVTEAYSRVLFEKDISRDEVEKAIRKLINSKISQGDLRDCALTFDDLETIIETFVNYLVKSNHKRISYKTNENA